MKTIFFDLDDTLVNHSKAEEIAIKQLYANHFLGNSYNEFYNQWKEEKKYYWQLYEQKILTFDQHRIETILAMKKRSNNNITRDEAQNILLEYIAIYENSWELFPYTLDMLLYFKQNNVRMGVITNGNEKQQYNKLLKNKLDTFFEKKLIIISEAVGFSKPEKNIFHLAQKSANILATEIIYMGDNVKTDIEPVLKLGWTAVLVDHKRQYNKMNYPVIHSFEDTFYKNL